MCKILGFSACVAMAAMLAGCDCNKAKGKDAKADKDCADGACVIEVKDASLEEAPATDAAVVEETDE